MNDWFNRLNWLLQLLMQGVRVDLAYSIVVILVITSLFSTPLILGSIKNKVYVAIKGQIEKENNAREITIQQADAEVQHHLDNEFLTELRSKYPDFQIVGNLKSVVMIEGPVGSQVKTLQTLVPDDPRTEALQIKPKIASDFGLFDIVISNQLGELLYEKEKWPKLWNSESAVFTGDPLTLSINDIPLKGQFQVVARQTTPGRKIYVSEQLGMALKKYSIGLGAEELELPMVPDLVQYSLPTFETMHCILDFPKNDCDFQQQEKIIKRLKAENFIVKKSQPMVTEINRFQVTLTQFDEINGRVQPSKGDCEQRLYHHIQACPSAIVTPKISLKAHLIQSNQQQSITNKLPGMTDHSANQLGHPSTVVMPTTTLEMTDHSANQLGHSSTVVMPTTTLEMTDHSANQLGHPSTAVMPTTTLEMTDHSANQLGHPSTVVMPTTTLEIKSAQSDTIQLSGITSRSYDWLPGIKEIADRQGGKKLDFWTEGLSERGIEMVAPYSANLPLYSVVHLQMDDISIPSVVTAYYRCPMDMVCPFYTTPIVVFRLQNIIDGAAIFKLGKNDELPIFYPTQQQQRIDYDEILFYTNEVEEVEELQDELAKALPGYRVEYNIYAIDKLKRQDQRLSTLFNLTLFLSILFIVLAVGALAKMNVDKRRRQMAQLFILGYSKSFVSVLLICEYLLLTMLASITAIGISSGVFAVARYFLQSSVQSTTDFATIINAMTLDLGAFAMVFIIVVLVTTLVAGYAAYYASKSDPVELLD